MIEQLTGRIARLESELAKKVLQVHQLNLTVRELNKQLKEAGRLRWSSFSGHDALAP